MVPSTFPNYSNVTNFENHRPPFLFTMCKIGHLKRRSPVQRRFENDVSVWEQNNWNNEKRIRKKIYDSLKHRNLFLFTIGLNLYMNLLLFEEFQKPLNTTTSGSGIDRVECRNEKWFLCAKTSGKRLDLVLECSALQSNPGPHKSIARQVNSWSFFLSIALFEMEGTFSFFPWMSRGCCGVSSFVEPGANRLDFPIRFWSFLQSLSSLSISHLPFDSKLADFPYSGFRHSFSNLYIGRVHVFWFKNRGSECTLKSFVFLLKTGKKDNSTLRDKLRLKLIPFYPTDADENRRMRLSLNPVDEQNHFSFQCGSLTKYINSPITKINKTRVTSICWWKDLHFLFYSASFSLFLNFKYVFIERIKLFLFFLPHRFSKLLFCWSFFYSNQLIRLLNFITFSQTKYPRKQP